MSGVMLNCYPICECGYLFKELTISREIDIDTEMPICDIIIKPKYCPNCHKKIEGIAMKKADENGYLDFEY